MDYNTRRSHAEREADQGQYTGGWKMSYSDRQDLYRRNEQAVRRAREKNNPIYRPRNPLEIPVVIGVIILVCAIMFLWSHFSDKHKERVRSSGDYDAVKVSNSINLLNSDNGELVGYIAGDILKDSLQLVMKRAQNIDGSYNIKKFPLRWYGYYHNDRPSNVFLGVIIYTSRNWLENEVLTIDTSHLKLVSPGKQKFIESYYHYSL